MKFVKEIILRLSIIIILDLIYYFFTKKSVFSPGMKGFFTLFLFFLIAELIFYFIEKKLKKPKNKNIA